MDGTPRHSLTALGRAPRLESGPGERFTGYGVVGLPFSSGHYLALRDMLASSIGEPYRTIWHRDPAGRWSIYTTTDPSRSCPRYFGRDARVVTGAHIHVAWLDERTLHVTMDGHLDWRLRLSSSPATRVMSRICSALPGWAWRNRWLRAAMGPMARMMLRAGRFQLAGLTPNDQRFAAAPRRIWNVASAHAVLDGTDLGACAPLEAQTHLGDFWMPQRGLVFAGGSRFTPGEAVARPNRA